MRRPFLTTAAIALGIVLLTDVLRVWLPSIITIFGQAASTPAELMGGFALLWFVGAIAVVPLLRPLGPRGVALAAGVALAGCRLGLLATNGGQAQLYVASAGLLAGLVWLAAVAVTGPTPVPGLVSGLAVGTALHAAVGTFDLTWRGGVFAWSVIALLCLAFVVAQPALTDQPSGSAAWFAVGPVLLLWTMVAGSPALAGTAVSYALGEEPGIAGPGPGFPVATAVLSALSVGLLAAGALLPRPGALVAVAGAAVLVAGTLAFALSWGAGLMVAIPTTALGLGLVLCATGVRAVGTELAPVRGYAAVGGMTVFAVAAVAYYASYDIGYPNEWVPPAVAALVAIVVARPPYRFVEVSRSWALAPAAVVVTLLAGLLMPIGASAAGGTATPGAIRVVAYNIRMGFGLDGRFDLPGLADAIRAERPDVVLLSEVDRAWLLNGGHDTVALLADRLGMPYRFAPAADAVWGDAVLTRLPVVYTATTRLRSVGAPTGAQALGVVLDAGGTEVAVVSTHLQPPPDGGPVSQAREVAAFARGFAAGRPLVVGGDLNTQPGDPAFAVFTDAGLVDGFAAARPVPTSPADAPREQIDHLLVSPAVAVTDVVAPRTEASDHLPIAATLTVG
ncbi:endonuclease/exonuclease/phosphatase family protein [Asanoa sp. WMMD1127]|uniref:endonuclease/exonuclease/phosphatase family protein n=1 Tax=Asanoa sp. WMMD1127 TaxID=3016107 RepID=UPI0024168D69|nr:endonuclease/exonuclease/phosphatase family protein [Asanoa sp. WMMD1127]MDG4823516.1 endonuclease/exonuclease/phosphatase family protein [Asanoa sp. WMMD1127]